MPRKNITFGLSEETYARLTGLLPAPVGTSANMDRLLDALEREGEPTEREELTGRIATLEEQLLTARERTAALEGENAALTGRIQQLEEELASAEERAGKLTEECARLTGDNARLRSEAPAATAADSLTIRMNPHVQSLLRETASRLSARYGTEITPDDILTKIFLRYTVERLTLWFYPFVLTDRDIAELTGRTPSEWREFLSESA